MTNEALVRKALEEARAFIAATAGEYTHSVDPYTGALRRRRTPELVTIDEALASIGFDGVQAEKRRRAGEIFDDERTENAYRRGDL